MSIPKEPRQLMINLMYLVLTAMLALNVSNEILHAFKIINKSIEGSNGAIQGKNNDIMMAFEANMQMDAKRPKVEPFYIKAKEVQAEADKVNAYLEEWKSKIITESGGVMKEADRDGDTSTPARQDNIDASTLLLVERKGGDEVRAKLEGLRKFMLDRLKDSSRIAIEKDLPLNIVDPKKSEENPQGSWTYGTFHNMPTMAAVTLFSKLQNDVRNAQSVVMQRLFDDAGAEDIKFDAITAIAVPKNSYVLAGAPIEANIMVAAYNKTVKPVISAPGGAVTVENGIGTWKGNASSSPGKQTVSGTIKLDLGSRILNEKWQFEYVVGSTGGSMQLDKMNVFYIGLDNPITISAAGYNMEDVRANVPGCEVIPDGKGHYKIRPTLAQANKTTEAQVIAKTAKGDEVVSRLNVRIKQIPNPRPVVAGKNGGAVRAAEFKVQDGVIAQLENFPYEVQAKILSYTVSNKRKGSSNVSADYQVRGPLFASDPTVRDIVATVKPGDKVYIDAIKALMPDGTTRDLGGMTFSIF